MKLPVMPVRSGQDATMNFERLQRALPGSEAIVERNGNKSYRPSDTRDCLVMIYLTPTAAKAATIRIKVGGREAGLTAWGTGVAESVLLGSVVLVPAGVEWEASVEGTLSTIRSSYAFLN